MCREMLKSKIRVSGFIFSLSVQYIELKRGEQGGQTGGSRLFYDSMIIHTSLFRTLFLYFLQMGNSSFQVIILVIQCHKCTQQMSIKCCFNRSFLLWAFSQVVPSSQAYLIIFSLIIKALKYYIFVSFVLEKYLFQDALKKTKCSFLYCTAVS